MTSLDPAPMAHTTRGAVCGVRRHAAWRDVEWLAREWSGPLAIKGVMTPEDARRLIAAVPPGS